MKYQHILLAFIIIVGFLLRFVDISNNPPGLYIDEASIGYNAYTILTTGKDEYGISHPFWFRSFGDYKMPVYIYSVSAAMAFLGKTELAVRIPSVLSGTLTIVVLYLFLWKLLSFEKDKKLREKLKSLPLLASFLLAISSWHIQFSRGGFEVTEGTLFFFLGCYLYTLFIGNKKWQAIIISIFFFILAIYTYHTFRVLSLLALLFIAFHQKIYKNPKSWPIILYTIILLLPILLFSLSPNGSERFQETSAFSQIATATIWQKILLYPLVYFNNYLSFFSFDFLFSFGDGIGRHQITNFGGLYRWEFPFLLGGIYLLLKQKATMIKYTTFLILLATPLAGAVAVPSPHALRSLPMIIPYMIIISLGLLAFIQNLKKFKQIILTMLMVIICFEFAFYLHFYYVHYLKTDQIVWGGAYKQLIFATLQKQRKYKHIVIDDTQGTLHFGPTYFHFYDPTQSVTVVPSGWKKPKTWNNEPTLYIRPYYGNERGENIIQNIYLPNLNHDVFAQLWELK